MGFWKKLAQSIEKRNSLLCVGLDPRPERISQRYAGVAEFCCDIVDATADIACVYKPNIAFFEALGLDGLRALRQVLDHIPEDIPVLLDAKRNDIASTAEAYARAVYDVLDVDAVTVTPYLGREGVAPFLAYEGRGVFALCKTSNPGAGAVQDWAQGGLPLYDHVAKLMAEWSEGRPYGLVIGATYPEAIARIRARAPQTWFLVPGVGAQGGDLQAVLRAGLRDDGMGLLISSSRGIIYADDPRQAAQTLHARINAARARRGAPEGTGSDEMALAKMLYDSGCVRFGDFVLHSGRHSPVYLDLRRLASHPSALAFAANAYVGLLESLEYDRLAAIPYAGLPIGTAVALQTDRPMIYPRREAKDYGTKRRVEGFYVAGERVVVLDDLITSGGSKVEAIEVLEDEGLRVEDVVVLVDREQGGAADLAQRGYRLHSVLTLRRLVELLARDGRLSPDETRRVFRYLDQA